MKNEILKIWSSSRPYNIKENTSLESFTNILKALFGLCNTIIFKIVQHLKYNQKIDRKVRRHNNLRKNYCVLYRMVHKYWLKISMQKVKWFSFFQNIHRLSLCRNKIYGAPFLFLRRQVTENNWRQTYHSCHRKCLWIPRTRILTVRLCYIQLKISCIFNGSIGYYFRTRVIINYSCNIMFKFLHRCWSYFWKIFSSFLNHSNVELRISNSCTNTNLKWIISVSAEAGTYCK